MYKKGDFVYLDLKMYAKWYEGNTKQQSAFGDNPVCEVLDESGNRVYLQNKIGAVAWIPKEFIVGKVAKNG